MRSRTVLPSKYARLLSLTLIVVASISLSGGRTTTVRGTTLEQPPSQPNGGGLNSSMSAGTITLAQPLNPNNSIDLRFLLGGQQEGKVKFCAVIETMPFTNSAVMCFSGGTAPLP